MYASLIGVTTLTLPNAGVCKHNVSYPDLCGECMTFDREMKLSAKEKVRELMQKLAVVGSAASSYASVERFRIMTDSHIEFYNEMEKLRIRKEKGE
jgi:hypothetical protein